MSIRFLARQLRIGFFFLMFSLLLFGTIYPASITLILQLFFPYQANGSLIKNKEKIIGSELIGQYFKAPHYFWGRPSAISPMPYDPTNSCGSNLGANNPLLIQSVKERTQYLISKNQENSFLIPVDLITSSGSGLDPHISINSAYFQLNRVAKARKISPDVMKNIIDQSITPRTWGFLGEPCVNVLMLNIKLDRKTASSENE